MWVKNALVYGRCVMEAGDGFLKVRNPRTISLTQDEDGELVDTLADGFVPVEDLRTFVGA